MGGENNDVQFQIKNCMNLCMKFLEICGLWYSNENKTALHSLYNWFTVCFSCAWTAFTYIHLYEARNNFSDLLETLTITISLTIFLFKLYVFEFKKKKIEHVVKAVAMNFHIHSETLSLENKEIIRLTLQQGRRMLLTYTGILLCGNAIFTILSPLLSPVPVNATEIVRPLPVRVWLPFDQMISPYYEIAYGLSTFACIFIGVMIISTDSFFFVIMIYLTGQFVLLADSLYNMLINVNKKVLHNLQNGRHDYNCRRENMGM